MAEADSSEDYLIHYFDLAFYKWVLVLSVSGFITLFLLAFQPFGVTNFDPHFSITLQFLGVLLAMGGVVGGTLALSEFILRPLLLPEPTRRQLLGWLAWDYVLVGSAAFLFYNYLGDWHDFHWLSWLGFIRDVGMVISFPVAGFIFFIRHESLKSRYVRLITHPTGVPSTKLLHLSSENGKDVLSVALGDLLYLESQDNYLAVVYMDQRTRRTTLIRSSLKRIEALLVPQLVRCHRSFIVNLQRVVSCHGNQHGLKLHMEGVEQPIPVSRAYTRIVLEKLGAAPATRSAT